MPLPDAATVMKRTPVFDAHTVPPALLREHRTKEGVWGRIVVVEGELLFRALEPARTEITLRAGDEHIVAPGLAHEVQLQPNTRFYVEFLHVVTH